MLTVLNDKFRDFDAGNPSSRAASKTYSFKTAFSVGLNVVSTGTENHPFLFLSGAITLGRSNKTGVDKSKSDNLL